MTWRRRGAWALVTLIAATGFASLGFWQSGRAAWKQQWLQAWADALQAAPVELTTALQTPLHEVPLRVETTLHLLPQPVLWLDNQQHAGQVGVRGYALAEVRGSPVPVLVELGWRPFGPARGLPELSVPSTPLTLRGLLLPWPAQGLRLGANQWENADAPQLLAYLDREEVNRQTGLTLYDGVLRPEPGPVLDAERDVVALPNTLAPEQHRGYAVQWWGLSATVVVVYLLLGLRRRKP